MEWNWALGLGLGLTAVLAALGGLLLLAALPSLRTDRRTSIFDGRSDGTEFLFDADILIDSTPGARAFLASGAARGSPMQRLASTLAPHFPDLEVQLLRLGTEGTVTLTSAPGVVKPLLLRAELRGGLTRITVIDTDSETRMPGQDALTHRALIEELDGLRTTVAQVPVLIWRERADTEVVWANAAYLMRANDGLAPGHDLSWPLPRIFERTASTQGATGQRQRLTTPDGRTAWYDLISFPDGDGRRVFALPADGAVQAETALRDFMQTLAKTFAHLPIGLAIFDRQRQLALFNPALLDLTGLPPDFLSMRPSLLSVLDAMRDRNMIPEPKDYRGWRRQILDLEKAAASGVYEETWSLPGGQTYRVIGRPHPNGALALMIEDITNEMSRTRRYRADLELGQSVIDEMEEAIAVFSQSGHLVMSNTAYSALWGHDPAGSLGDSGIVTLSAHWRSLSAPSALWAEAEEFVATMGDRQSWTGEARLNDGRLIGCRFAPLAAGATLVAFLQAPPGTTRQTRLPDSKRRRSA